MVIENRNFHVQESGTGHKSYYSLARELETGDIFILHEWSHRDGIEFDSGENKIPLHAFLCGHGASQASLRDLIGTLLDGTRSDPLPITK